MKWLFVFFLFIPHFSFGKWKDSGVLEGEVSVLQERSAKIGDNYIGTVRQVKDGKIVVQLRRDLEIHKKEIQVASTTFATQNQIIPPIGQQKPVHFDIYNLAGVKKGPAKLSAVNAKERTVVLEVVRGQLKEVGVGWKIGLQDNSSIREKDGKTDFGLGMFYKLDWR